MLGAALISSLVLGGCASVPMGSAEQDAELKQFSAPAADKAGLYIYRNSFAGKALKKTVSLNGKVVGETANKVYFYQEVAPGQHVISTESEFGDNSVTFQAVGGKNYFARQYIKMGVLVGGAGIEMVDEATGMKEVRQSSLAQAQ
ncbi:hypothetical protein DNK34_09360 [Pseudomonas dryadis]|uniref:DUF2846 domain-containing protein n=2 Tax=Pseudomonadales TaxID=72274 RepID=A0A4Q9R3V4_9GAMM|nr:hypothetical protein DNK44_10825 [Pseudomonas dryadis]TBV07024.1 hypothetical protein DNK34_09360 [Pseudomonas dryadis]TBV19583.1 hypothetical protein DNK41_03355 [Pseudomonas sp. FRB 230]